MLVAPGTVVDTTAGPGWEPLTVTARMAEPVMALAQQPCLLDGPLSFGAFQAAGGQSAPLPPIGDWAVDFALPLATWTRPAVPGCDARLLGADGALWGWACSRAFYAADADSAVQVRRRPAVAEMARFTSERRHHLGLGPYKARDVTQPAVVTRLLTWRALGDADAVRSLLDLVTHVGRSARSGHGRVLSWEVAVDPAGADRWAQRTFPHPDGVPEALRAPYWHRSRRVPCL